MGCDDNQPTTVATSDVSSRSSGYDRSDDSSSCCSSSTGSLTSASTNSSASSANRRRVSYGPVTVYYFVRSQGFSCVPSFGGNTLGMSRKHYASRSLTLQEHQEEIRQYRETSLTQQQQDLIEEQQQLQQQVGASFDKFFYQNQQLNFNNNNQSISSSDQVSASDLACEEQLDEEEEEEEDEEDQEDEVPEETDEAVDEENEASCSTSATPSLGHYDEVFHSNNLNDPKRSEPYPPFPSGAEEMSAFDVEMPEEYYIQPLDNKQRRLLLKGLGAPLDQTERTDCQAIRLSRQNCGCSCVNGLCLPETCSCALSSIKCQVDRPSFPCACVQSTCQNPVGRVEFNATRVRSHYLTTMMRLRLTDRASTEEVYCSAPQQQHTSPVHTRFETDYESSYVEQPSSFASATAATSGLHYKVYNNNNVNSYAVQSLQQHPQPETYKHSGPGHVMTSLDRFPAMGQQPEPVRKRLRLDDSVNNQQDHCKLDQKYSLTTLYTKRQRRSMGIDDDLATTSNNCRAESSYHLESFNYYNDNSGVRHFASTSTLMTSSTTNGYHDETKMMTSSTDSDYDSASGSPPAIVNSVFGPKGSQEASQPEKPVCETARA